jgi:hypothetical protein
MDSFGPVLMLAIAAGCAIVVGWLLRRLGVKT